MEVCEALNRLTPGDAAKKRSALFNSGAEAVENAVKIARAYTGATPSSCSSTATTAAPTSRWRMTAKNMPYKQAFGPFAGEVYRVPLAYPFHDGPRRQGRGRKRAITRIDKEVGAQQRRRHRHRADRRRGRVHRPGARASCRRSSTTRSENGIVFVADEIQTGFCRTGDWFACDARGRRPRPDHDREGHRRRAAAGRGHRPRRDHGRARTSAASAARTAATRSPAPPRSAPSRRSRTQDLRRRGPPHRVGHAARAARDAEQVPRHRRRPRPRRDARRRAGPAGHPRARRRATAADRRRLPPAGRARATAGTYGNVLRFLPPLVIPEHLLDEALDVLERRSAPSDPDQASGPGPGRAPAAPTAEPYPSRSRSRNGTGVERLRAEHADAGPGAGRRAARARRPG